MKFKLATVSENSQKYTWERPGELIFFFIEFWIIT